MKIPLIKPYMTDEIKQMVLDVLESGYLTEGPVTHEFELFFGKYVGSKHTIAVTSCTTGLEIALRALKIGPGDEVIVPDYTYPATANIVSIVGAHCIIVDINTSNLLIDYDAIESAITSRTKAIIPVSLFGNPLDYERLEYIKKKYGVFIIEDAACSIGAEYKSKMVGSIADISVFSLHPRKFITSGEGGMISTNNDEWAEWINSYKHFGMLMNNQSREGVSFEMVGTNYKLSNIQAAIGLGQMKHVEELLKRRRELAANYDKLFEDHDNIMLPEITKDGLHSYQSYCILTPSRDKIMNTLRPQGIEVQIGTYSLHMHPVYSNTKLFTIKGNMDSSRKAFHQCLALPLYHDLTFDQQKFIFNKIKELA